MCLIWSFSLYGDLIHLVDFQSFLQEWGLGGGGGGVGGVHQAPEKKRKKNAPKGNTLFAFREDPFSEVIQTITKTCLYNFDPLKPHAYIVKLGFTAVYIICLISRRGGSNE